MPTQNATPDSKFDNKEGQKVPSVTFPIRVNDSWSKRDSQDVFAGKTVVVFSLPGAFTPTCSSSHLPRYNELASKFSENGDKCVPLDCSCLRLSITSNSKLA